MYIYKPHLGWSSLRNAVQVHGKLYIIVTCDYNADSYRIPGNFYINLFLRIEQILSFHKNNFCECNINKRPRGCKLEPHPHTWQHNYSTYQLDSCIRVATPYNARFVFIFMGNTFATKQNS